MKRKFGSDNLEHRTKIFLRKGLDFFSKDAIIMITVTITNIKRR